MGLFKKKSKPAPNERKKPLKKVGQAIKKVAVNTSKGIKHVAEKTAQAAKKVATKGGEKAALLLFAPLAVIAAIFLKRRGVKPAGDLKALALQVHNERSKKTFGYTGPDSFDYGMTTAEEFGYIDGLGVDHRDFGLIPITPEIIIGVVSFLKGIFSSIKAKREKGEKLSEDEQKIADQAAEIDSALGAAKDAAGEVLDDHEKEADNILTGANTWKIVLAVVILIALFIWLRSRK